MKKIFFVLLAISLLFVGCSKDNEDNEVGENAKLSGTSVNVTMTVKGNTIEFVNDGETFIYNKK